MTEINNQPEKAAELRRRVEEMGLALMAKMIRKVLEDAKRDHLTVTLMKR